MDLGIKMNRYEVNFKLKSINFIGDLLHDENTNVFSINVQYKSYTSGFKVTLNNASIGFCELVGDYNDAATYEISGCDAITGKQYSVKRIVSMTDGAIIGGDDLSGEKSFFKSVLLNVMAQVLDKYINSIGDE